MNRFARAVFFLLPAVLALDALPPSVECVRAHSTWFSGARSAAIYGAGCASVAPRDDYEFQNNGNDSAGPNNLTAVGTPAFSTSVFWRGSYSYGPPTAKNYYKGPSAVCINPASSWSLWGALYYDGSADTVMIRQANASNPADSLDLLMTPSSEMRLSYRNVAVIMTSSTPLLGNSWNTLGVTYDAATHGWVMYQNGARVAGGTNALPGFTAGNMFVGSDGSNLHYGGYWGGLKIFKCALTAAQVARLSSACLDPNANSGYLLDGEGRNLYSVPSTNGAATIRGNVVYATAPISGRINAVTGFGGPWDNVGGSTPSYISFTAAQNAAFSDLATGGFSCDIDLTTTPETDATILCWSDTYLGESPQGRGETGIRLNGPDTMDLYFNGGEIPFGGKLNIPGANHLAVWWSSNGYVYGYVNGTLTGAGYPVGRTGSTNPTYGITFGTGAVTDLTLGTQLDIARTNRNGRSLIGYIYDVHFYRGNVPFEPPVSDSCGGALRPTLTPALTFQPTPTPDATAVPQCWPTPGEALTIAPCPVETPNPISGISMGEPDLELCVTSRGRGTWDPYHDVIHYSYSAENLNTNVFTINLAVATGLHPTDPPHTGMQNEREVGTLVGDGVLGVTANVHGSFQAHLAAGNDWLFWGTNPGSGRDGTGGTADGSIYMAQSVDSGYHYVTATVTKIIPISMFSGFWWCANSTNSAFVVGIQRDPFVRHEWWGIVELDNGREYSWYPTDLLWLIKLTDNGSTFTSARLASPLPLKSALCAGPDAIAQGPRAFSWNAAGGYWDGWESVTMAGPIWHMRSPDLYNWTCDGAESISNSRMPNTWGLAWVNQVADVSGGFEYAGYWWFAMSAMNNSTNNSASGLFWFPGTQRDYDSCVVPTYSPTLTFTPSPITTPTATPSRTFTPTATPSRIFTPTATPSRIFTPTATPASRS